MIKVTPHNEDKWEKQQAMLMERWANFKRPTKRHSQEVVNKAIQNLIYGDIDFNLDLKNTMPATRCECCGQMVPEEPVEINGTG